MSRLPVSRSHNPPVPSEGTWVWSKTKHARGKVIEVTELCGRTQLRLWLQGEDVVPM